MKIEGQSYYSIAECTSRISNKYLLQVQKRNSHIPSLMTVLIQGLWELDRWTWLIRVVGVWMKGTMEFFCLEVDFLFDYELLLQFLQEMDLHVLVALVDLLETWRTKNRRAWLEGFEELAACSSRTLEDSRHDPEKLKSLIFSIMTLKISKNLT